MWLFTHPSPDRESRNPSNGMSFVLSTGDCLGVLRIAVDAYGCAGERREGESKQSEMDEKEGCNKHPLGSIAFGKLARTHELPGPPPSDQRIRRSRGTPRDTCGAYQWRVASSVELGTGEPVTLPFTNS